MKKNLLTLLILLGAGIMSFAQTAGEKESYETMKSAANLYLENGDYAAAKAQYEGIFKLYRQYENFTKEIRSDYEKCLREIDKAAAARKESERLVFSEPFINFNHLPGTHRVTVLAGKGGTGKWEVESCPDWCKLNQDGNALDITVGQNPDPAFRNSEIIIKMAVSAKKVVTRGLPILQIARPLEERSVRIITNPAGAMVTVGNDPTPRISPVTLTLKEGEIPVHIIRNDYFTIDTFITVSADDDPKNTKEYRYDLTSRFSLARLTLKAGTGNLDNKNPKLFIGNRQIDLDGYYGRGTVKTIHTAGAVINHYDLYQDAQHNIVIPLEPGTYQVTATAEDFEDYNYTFTAQEGETFPLDIVMTPKRGTIRLFCGKNAEGAVVKDGLTPIGTLTGEHLDVPLTADDHKISFEKKDFMSEEPVYNVHVNPGETIDYEVNMVPLSYLTILTEPIGVEVLINGLSEGIRTPVISKAVPLGSNTILLRQKGYYPVTRPFQSSIIGRQDTLNVTLLPSHPLEIRSDSYRSSRNVASGFNIYIQSLDKSHDIQEYDHYTDTIINLPYGKYSYEFRRFSKGPKPGYANGLKLQGEKKKLDLAYKGIFKFDERHKTLSRMSYSETGCFSFLWANMLLMDNQIGYEGNSFQEIGSAGLLRLPMWPGFSSSLIRGTAFKGTTDSTTPNYLFNATCLLLNGEQRIGGNLHQFLDVDLLFTYAWLPHLNDAEWLRSSLPNLSYVDMTDLFFGLELHTRMMALNANFRIGYRFQKGNINLYSGKTFTYHPFDNSGIMASVGFALGGRDSKGANILRVFYL